MRSSAIASAAPISGESDADVRAKAEAALAAGLVVIVCVGESEAQREAGEPARAIVGAQLDGSLPDDWEEGELAVAYEPVWAIGTGKVADARRVAAMHAAIRARAASARYGERGGRVRILYGGSVKADNAAELFAVADVDGALVGGASLTAASSSCRSSTAAARELKPQARSPTIARNRVLPGSPNSSESPSMSGLFTFLLIVQALVAAGAGRASS